MIQIPTFLDAKLPLQKALSVWPYIICQLAYRFSEHVLRLMDVYQTSLKTYIYGPYYEQKVRIGLISKRSPIDKL